MQVKWKTLTTKVIVWVALELAFSFLGLDQLADYSEYLFHPRLTVLTSYASN